MNSAKTVHLILLKSSKLIKSQNHEFFFVHKKKGIYFNCFSFLFLFSEGSNFNPLKAANSAAHIDIRPLITITSSFS